MNKETFDLIKKKNHAKNRPSQDVWPIMKSLFHVWCGKSEVIEPEPRKIKPFNHKYAGIEPFDGKTTEMSVSAPGGPVVPNKRSLRAKKWQSTGRYSHKKWPFEKKAV
jgi:hypothetical protein